MLCQLSQSSSSKASSMVTTGKSLIGPVSFCESSFSFSHRPRSYTASAPEPDSLTLNSEAATSSPTVHLGLWEKEKDDSQKL